MLEGFNPLSADDLQSSRVFLIVYMRYSIRHVAGLDSKKNPLSRALGECGVAFIVIIALYFCCLGLVFSV